MKKCPHPLKKMGTSSTLIRSPRPFYEKGKKCRIFKGSTQYHHSLKNLQQNVKIGMFLAQGNLRILPEGVTFTGEKQQNLGVNSTCCLGQSSENVH